MGLFNCCGLVKKVVYECKGKQFDTEEAAKAHCERERVKDFTSSLLMTTMKSNKYSHYNDSEYDRMDGERRVIDKIANLSEIDKRKLITVLEESL